MTVRTIPTHYLDIESLEKGDLVEIHTAYNDSRAWYVGRALVLPLHDHTVTRLQIGLLRPDGDPIDWGQGGSFDKLLGSNRRNLPVLCAERVEVGQVLSLSQSPLLDSNGVTGYIITSFGARDENGVYTPVAGGEPR